jgi:hypothetical protein
MATPATYIDQFQCGWRIEPGDTDALISLLEKLADDRPIIRESGHRSRETFEQCFDRAMGVARVSAAIHSGFASDHTSHAGIHSAKPSLPRITLENERRQRLTL